MKTAEDFMLFFEANTTTDSAVILAAYDSLSVDQQYRLQKCFDVVQKKTSVEDMYNCEYSTCDK